MARIGRIFFGAALGVTVDVVAATAIATSNGTSGGWALAMVVLFYGAPIAVLIGAVTARSGHRHPTQESPSPAPPPVDKAPDS